MEKIVKLKNFVYLNIVKKKIQISILFLYKN